MSKIYTDDWDIAIKKINISIKTGYGCKLKNPIGEKFWVLFITEKDGYYLGKINNILFLNSPYNIGDIVVFDKKHILEVMTPKRRQKESNKIKKIVNDFNTIYKRTPTIIEIEDIILNIKKL